MHEELNINIELYEKYEDLVFGVFYNRFFKNPSQLNKLNENIEKQINFYEVNAGLGFYQKQHIATNHLLAEINASSLSQFSKNLFEYVANQISSTLIKKSINFEEICNTSPSLFKEKIKSAQEYNAQIEINEPTF